MGISTAGRERVEGYGVTTPATPDAKQSNAGLDAKIRESVTSQTPPKPESNCPLSLAPHSRLTYDSARSPSIPVIASNPPRTIEPISGLANAAIDGLDDGGEDEPQIAGKSHVRQA